MSLQLVIALVVLAAALAYAMFKLRRPSRPSSLREKTEEPSGEEDEARR